uniref:hypothetical protein n=1 Tax=Acetatifactor sp. TaxID=1872090 RepID=UPI004057A627
MQTIESVLREELCQLKKIVEEARVRLKTAPKGHLRIMKKRGHVEYYFKSDDIDGTNRNNANGRYMKKSEKNLAEGIAQRDYDVHVMKNADERIKAIDTFLKKYKRTSLERLYENTNQYRKELIEAPIISDSQFIKQWQSVKYEGKPFADEAQEIITERGERVRSKSEKIIADKLNTLGIPYRYEFPLVLEGNIRVYPDFTILKMPAREEVFLEHLGMMDDSDYVQTVIYKLNTYEKNGIYIGVNLFITYETSKKTLNTRALDGMLKKLFCAE